MKNSELKATKLNRTEAVYKLIGETNNGLIFNVTFIKKDGSIRKMRARRKVSKGINGKGAKYNAMSKGLLTVFDMQKQQWRNINFETVRSFSANKNKYEVI